MAFVSDDLKLVFIHIPKTGGTSIAKALCEMHGEDLVRPEGFYAHAGVGGDIPAAFKPNGIGVHDTLPQILDKYPEASNYDFVCVVRNPWDRIFSFYKHKLRRRDRDLPIRPRTQKPFSFNETFRVSNVLLLQPQPWWLDPDLNVTVLRFEDLEEDWHQFWGRRGLLGADLPRLNTDHTGSDYRAAYDEHTERLVRYYYTAEIQEYGYEF